MAAIDLNHVQFWKPPSDLSLQKQRKAPQPVLLPNKSNLYSERNKQFDCTVPVIQHQGRDFEAQPKHKEARVQGRNHDPAHSVSDADDDLPSIEELLDSYKQTKIVETGQQGTQGRPLILDDDDLDPAADFKDSIGAGPDFALEMSSPVDPYSRNEWWDVEAGCFANEDLLLLASSEHRSAASTLTQDKLRARQQSLGSTQDQTNLHGDDRTAQSTPQELAPQSQLTTLDASSREGSGKHILCPRRLTLPNQLQIVQDHGQGRLGLQSDLHSHGQAENSVLRQEQAQEVAVDEIREAGLEEGDLNADTVDDDNNDGNKECRQRGEKRQHDDTGSSSSIICHSERSGRSDPANNKDEENPRPMKRSRLSLASPDSPLTPPSEKSPTPCLGEPQFITPLSTAQLERDDVQPPQADRRYLSAPAESESAPAAEYREWPFQGFLKRVTFNGQTTFNLEFSLPCISEDLKPPSHSKHFGASSSNSSVKDAHLITSRITRSGKPFKFKRPLPPASALSSRSRFSAEDNDSKEWWVEEVLGERHKKLPGRGSRTRLEYQVKWQGHAKPTWEPATALEDTAALDAYLKSGKGALGKNANESNFRTM